MIELRPAMADELSEILNLLGHYDVGPDYFSPWYLRDPDYQVDHSWIVREGGALVAHLRVFPRRLRLAGGGEIFVAGIGNVITHPDHRGRGHAAHLLEEALEDASKAGYAYSLLWTHLPQVYGPHGYGESSQLVLELQPSEQARRRRSRQHHYQVTTLDPQDLPDVTALYDQAHQSRAGTTIRTESYWQGLLARTTPDTLWLLARSEDGSVAGHMRAVARPEGGLLVEELSFIPMNSGTATALIDAATTETSSSITIVAPPSYKQLFGDRVRVQRHEPGLMGKPLNLGNLARALSSVHFDWSSHVQPDGVRIRLVGPQPSDGDLLITPSGTTVVRTDPSKVAVPLDAAQITTLLFANDQTAGRRATDSPSNGADALPTNFFPADDPVLWPVDAF